MRKLIWILFLVGCSNVPVVEQVTPLVPVVQKDFSQEIKRVVIAAPCSKTSWPGRGHAPDSFYIEIAKHFHRDVCHKAQALPRGDEKSDALTWYGLEPTTKNVYVFLLGLGMRENSGNFCGGRDTTAKKPSAVSAETGLFQFSYDSLNSSTRPLGSEIYAKYKASCPATIPCDRPNYGTGPGAEFQQLGKTCPAFAIDYAAYLIRVLRTHYGPINRKEVTIMNSCGAMLDQIGALGC